MRRERLLMDIVDREGLYDIVNWHGLLKRELTCV
jgi:hypothetical protein